MEDSPTAYERERTLLARRPVLEAVAACLGGLVAAWPDLAQPHVRAVLRRLPRRRLLAVVAAVPSKDRYAALGEGGPGRQRRLLRAMRRDPDMEFVLRFVADQARPIVHRLRKGMIELYAFYLQALAVAWAAASGAEARVWLTGAERRELARATLGGERLETLVRRVLGGLCRKLASAPARAALAPVNAAEVARAMRRAANGALNTTHKELRLVAEECLFLGVRQAVAARPRFVETTRSARDAH